MEDIPWVAIASLVSALAVLVAAMHQVKSTTDRERRIRLADAYSELIRAGGLAVEDPDEYGDAAGTEYYNCYMLGGPGIADTLELYWNAVRSGDSERFGGASTLLLEAARYETALEAKQREAAKLKFNRLLKSDKKVIEAIRRSELEVAPL